MAAITKSSNLALAQLRLPGQAVILGLSALAGCLFILVLDLVFGGTARGGAFWIGKGDSVFPYPFTIQNAEHILFFMALGELLTRWRVAKWEQSFLKKNFLPEDDQTILEMADLGPLRRKVTGQFDSDNGFLPYLIDLSILQAQASRSVDQTVSVLNATLELIAHKVDLRYQLLRYLAWAIPTVGFIGTVAGIASALGLVDPENMEIRLVTG
ncbi:MAG: MotA/TolQ/ExbB proton channel family protein, partial [Parvularculaceae bacterium]